MDSKSNVLVVSLGTKICSVQLDSCSGHSESWLLPIQLPSHNISRELQQDWAKSEVTWRHLWVMDSSAVWFGSHHRCNDSVGGRPGRLITRSKGGSSWSFSPDPSATAWLQLLFFFLLLIERLEKIYFIGKMKKKGDVHQLKAIRNLSANGLHELIFMRELELVYWMCRSG